MSKRVCSSSGGAMVVVGGVQGDEEISYSRGNAGKRIDVCMPSILPDWGSNGSIMVEFYVNGQFVHFLVCGPPNLALTRRYSRIFTGAITGPVFQRLFLRSGHVLRCTKQILVPTRKSSFEHRRKPTGRREGR